MRAPHHSAPYDRAWKLVIACFIALMPLRSAQAYIDPNAAGPLYQFLFPMLVAIASAIAAARRVLKRVWGRLVSYIAGTRSESRGSNSTRRT